MVHEHSSFEERRGFLRNACKSSSLRRERETLARFPPIEISVVAPSRGQIINSLKQGSAFGTPDFIPIGLRDRDENFKILGYRAGFRRIGRPEIFGISRFLARLKKFFQTFRSFKKITIHNLFIIFNDLKKWCKNERRV